MQDKESEIKEIVGQLKIVIEENKKVTTKTSDCASSAVTKRSERACGKR
ncbi:hypothetical protein ACT7DJ_12850 [Bacillus cereus]